MLAHQSVMCWLQVTEVAGKARDTAADAYHATVERAEGAVQAALGKVRHAQ